MDTNNVSKYLKFANVQMAAESLFSDAKTDGIGMGEKIIGEEMNLGRLLNGNNRASRFTPTLATQFLDNWTVVEHLAKTPGKHQKHQGSESNCFARCLHE